MAALRQRQQVGAVGERGQRGREEGRGLQGRVRLGAFGGGPWILVVGMGNARVWGWRDGFRGSTVGLRVCRAIRPAY